MASQTMLAGMKFSINGTPNSHASLQNPAPLLLMDYQEGHNPIINPPVLTVKLFCFQFNIFTNSELFLQEIHQVLYLKHTSPFTLQTSNTLVTRDQPYLYATIFKHFIYVCFQLLIFMNEN